MSAAATTKLTGLPRSPSLPTFFDNLDSFAEAPEGVAKLRELILDLAVRGKLVEQDENDAAHACRGFPDVPQLPASLHRR